MSVRGVRGDMEEEYKVPTIEDYENMLRPLKSQRRLVDKQIKVIESVLEAIRSTKKPRRKRPKSQEVLALEAEVRRLVESNGDQIKVIDLINELSSGYLSKEDLTQEDVRNRLQALRKSQFLVKGDKYGYVKLGETRAV